MVRGTSLLLLSAALVSGTTARDVPANVKALYEWIRHQGKCRYVLAGGFHSLERDHGNFDYCGDRLKEDKVLYIQGKQGNLPNMDIDCDGIQLSPADDGRCGSSTDMQSVTSFADILRSYSTNARDLDANIHPYVVFGNKGTREGYKTFDPRKYGVEPLSVMAVVCNNKLIYGVWGDEHGDDDPQAMVGEASISLATACYGKSTGGDIGYDGNDVLYLAFQGKDAVPGARGANWTAQSYEAFAASISSLGDELVGRIKGDKPAKRHDEGLHAFGGRV
ncbi:hypothetical protein E4U50_007051 [Claviceps purpurea]|nr:hypothetical protein E4U51_005109 [Claviceps purpurea]KAG6215713.1 hypothetical protein E4U50_007051 [Claviceps purpurea]